MSWAPKYDDTFARDPLHKIFYVTLHVHFNIDNNMKCFLNYLIRMISEGSYQTEDRFAVTDINGIKIY